MTIHKAKAFQQPNEWHSNKSKKSRVIFFVKCDIWLMYFKNWKGINGAIVSVTTCNLLTTVSHIYSVTLLKNTENLCRCLTTILKIDHILKKTQYYQMYKQDSPTFNWWKFLLTWVRFLCFLKSINCPIFGKNHELGTIEGLHQ